MLNRLLAPAQFLFFRPTHRREEISRISNSAQSVPAVKHLTTQKPESPQPEPPNRYGHLQKTSRKIHVVDGVSAEQFVKNLLSPNAAAQKNDKSPIKNSVSLNLNVTYDFKSVTTKKTGSGNNRHHRAIRHDIVRKYHATHQLEHTARRRDSEVKLFYRQTEEFASHIKSERADNYRGVRNKIAASFRYDFSIDFGFLQQFHNQSQQMNELGDEAFNGYVKSTDMLIDRSPKITTSFFNTVDKLLDSSRKNFLSKVEQFFNDLKKFYKEKADFIEKDKATIINQVTEFFDKVETLLDQAETTYLKSTDSSQKKEPVNPESEHTPITEQKNPEPPDIDTQQPQDINTVPLSE